MDILAAVLGIGFAAASGIAVALFVGATIDIGGGSRRMASTRRRVAGAATPQAGAAVGRLIAPPDTGVIGRFLEGNRFGRVLAQEVVNAGISGTPAQFVKRVLWGALAGLAAGTVFTRSIAAGLVVAVGVCIASRVWLQGASERRLEAMRRQIPDAFTVVGSSLSSGLSLVQSLQYAADETPAPLGPELFRLVNDVAAGLSLGEALERFRQSVPLRELKTISTAIEIQHRVGGNIREMLEQATSSVRQSLELRMSLQSQTAQGRLSAQVVGLMPLGLLGIISLLSKDYLSSFFSSTAGLVMFSIGITLDLVGYSIIRKIMDIEV